MAAPPALVFSIVYDIKRLAEWDGMVKKATVVKKLTDRSLLVHSELARWSYFIYLIFTKFSVFPLASRDLSLVVSYQEYTDGSYAVIYRSLAHPAIPEQKGFVRANLEPTGFIIRPSANKRYRSSEVECVYLGYAPPNNQISCKLTPKAGLLGPLANWSNHSTHLALLE